MPFSKVVTWSEYDIGKWMCFDHNHSFMPLILWTAHCVSKISCNARSHVFGLISFLAGKKLAKLKLLINFCWSSEADLREILMIYSFCLLWIIITFISTLLKVTPLIITCTWGNTNTLVTQDIITNSFSAMLHFCNCEHKLDPTGIITFGIGDSFKFCMLNSRLGTMLNNWRHNKSGSWIIEVLIY